LAYRHSRHKTRFVAGYTSPPTSVPSSPTGSRCLVPPSFDYCEAPSEDYTLTHTHEDYTLTHTHEDYTFTHTHTTGTVRVRTVRALQVFQAGDRGALYRRLRVCLSVSVSVCLSVCLSVYLCVDLYGRHRVGQSVCVCSTLMSCVCTLMSCVCSTLVPKCTLGSSAVLYKCTHGSSAVWGRLTHTDTRLGLAESWGPRPGCDTHWGPRPGCDTHWGPRPGCDTHTHIRKKGIVRLGDLARPKCVSAWVTHTHAGHRQSSGPSRGSLRTATGVSSPAWYH
jgi:hypothetical protein